MKKRIRHNIGWFIERIGIYIYRKSIKRRNCKTTIYVSDMMHAYYLYGCQNNLCIEYFDKEK